MSSVTNNFINYLIIITVTGLKTKFTTCANPCFLQAATQIHQ